MATHILSNFEDALRELRNDALMMASLTERNLENARKGLFERDEDWCNTVIADDEEIDALEVQVDTAGIAVMLRFHPVATDLRVVLAAMKLSVNLERIADQAVNIARRGRKLLHREPVSELSMIEPIYLFASSMLQDANKAYADNDVELARTLKPRDRELDAMNKALAEKVTDLMPGNPNAIPSYLDLIFISRFLERIGDQAKNIAEDTVFAVVHEDIRHTLRPEED